MTQLLFVNYSITSKVLIFATIIRWNRLLLFVCHSFLIESSFFSPLTWLILSQNSIRLSLFNLDNIFTPTKLNFFFLTHQCHSQVSTTIFPQFHTVSKIITSRDNKQNHPFATKKPRNTMIPVAMLNLPSWKIKSQENVVAISANQTHLQRTLASYIKPVFKISHHLLSLFFSSAETTLLSLFLSRFVDLILFLCLLCWVDI